MFDVCLAVSKDRVSPARLRQATLADLTSTLQDLLIEYDVPGVLFAGFEDNGQWERDGARYRQLAASPGRTVAVACRGPLEGGGETQTFELGEDHPFEDHWLLIARTPMVSATLVARALPGDAGEDGDERPFEAVWSFDPDVATSVGEALAGLLDEPPELRRFIAATLNVTATAPMDHGFGQRYGVAILERLETSRRHWRDLTVELENARQGLEDRTERQLKLERLASIGTLAASVAHELNNPLASITMAAKLMGQLDDADERARMAGIIESEALRAGRIAGDLLSFVADRDLELTNTRLDLWLEDVAAGYRGNGRRVAMTAGPAIEAEVDTDRLRQVMTNLVDNALDAIDRDGTIEFQLALTDEEVHIHVSDDGVGIPVDLRERLFDPFVTSKPRGRGTGLGLPIARAHLQDHGGDLELVHTGSTGTRFRIRLPRTVVLSETATPEGLPGKHEVTAPSNAGGRVLVVDDEPPIRALLETLLCRSGWKVVTASGLHEALSAVRAGPVDIALIDVQLGVHDGPAVLEQLEQVQPGLRPRCAFVTGAPPESGEVDGRPVLAKPFSWGDLSRLLERLGGA